ncbi:MAG: NUDIX-like domain-containing protein, partial [Pseudohongiellaceae bacterium]
MSGYFFSKDSLSKEDRVLLFVGNRILVRNGEFLWRRDQIAEEFIAQDTMIKVSHGREDFLVTRAPAGAESFLDAELSSLRSLLFGGDERAMLVAGKANQLLDWFDDTEVSKPALIDVLRVHKEDLSVHELLQRAYDLEPKESAAV